MRRLRTGAAVLVGLALAMSTSAVVGAPATADEPVTPVPSAESAPVAAPARAAGLVVTTRAAERTVRKETDKLLGRHAEVDTVSKEAPSTSVVRFDNDVSASTAQAVAKKLAKRSDIVAVEPDYIRTIADTAPVVPDDQLFPQQLNLWDSRTSASPEVSAVLGSASFPRGGFGVKAPEFWSHQAGSAAVTVAVLDTGSTVHPDLSWAAGRDLISDPAMAGDGDGRDGDPADEGDWVTAGQCGPGTGASDSTWHGTHVAGIIAAEKDNGIGVAGIAPGVTLQPVRVLGHCGGVDSDIAAGITWASGGSVSGVPDNPRPADIINMSFGGPGSCPDFVQSAIDGAVGRGTLLVAAAGNENRDASGYFPANCNGVIAVAATDEYGYRAWYSNYGPTVDIAAPGGDTSRNNRGIWSTVNTGAHGPVSAGWGQKQGTSMAAPVVSAVAALLRSDGVPASQLTERLLKQVQFFTAAVSPTPWQRVCTGAYSCGSGIIDLETPSLTSLSAPTSIWRHGVPMPVDVTVTSAQGPVNGRVNIMRGSILLGSGTVVDGHAHVTIVGSKVPSGIHGITARFLGQPGIAPSMSPPAVITVYRAVSGTVIAFPVVKFTRKQRPMAYIWIRAAGEPKPVGWVRVYDGKKLILSTYMTSAQNGNLIVHLPKFSKTGKHRIKAVYHGDANVIGSTSIPKTIHIRK